MISPDVASAVTRLESEGILGPEQARLFGRVARAELVSLSPAIHALLYLGVIGLTTGAGLLFKNEIANLGPISIAAGVGLVACVCLLWAARRSPPFSKGEVPTPHFAFDYVLVLGTLLAAADLAFIEVQFTPLGPQWPFHLLGVSLGYATLAFRFDSRTLFALSLTTFAAWRGVAATSLEQGVFGFFNDAAVVRANALACGLAFVVLGRALDQRRVKAHFEPTATHLGWLLILQAIAWGIGSGPAAALHRLTLILVGGGLAWGAWRGGRFALFVFGILAGYLAAAVSLASAVRSDTAVLFLVGASALLLVFGLTAVHRRFPKEAEE